MKKFNKYVDEILNENSDEFKDKEPLSSKEKKIMKDVGSFTSDLKTWNDLDGDDFSDLLSVYPKYAERLRMYDWEKLDDSSWKYLLKRQPQLKKYK